MPSMISRLATPLAIVCALSAALALGGCQGTMGLEPVLAAKASGSTDEGDDTAAVEGRKMIGEPYKVGGRWYYPKEDEDYDEVGMASWYGAEFHGSRTANGERFDAGALTAAHPTLPLPSYVRVTNLKTGKAAVVRINDRGPFHRGRIIDVSRAAADKLGFRSAGAAKVRVQYLGPAPVGGGDRETLMAEAKYGTAAGKGSGLGRFLPFGLGGSEGGDDDAGTVGVRLASTAPARKASPLPGVSAPSAVVTAAPQPTTTTAVASTAAGTASSAPPATAVAYQEPAREEMDALVAMSGEEAAPPPQPARAVATPAVAQPALRAAEPEEAESRILGAHELFAAIDSSSGGAGELNGIKPAE